MVYVSLNDSVWNDTFMIMKQPQKQIKSPIIKMQLCSVQFGHFFFFFYILIIWIAALDTVHISSLPLESKTPDGLCMPTTELPDEKRTF